jgi:hypothetical protein
MNHIFDGLMFALSLGLIPYAIAVAMPSWRWLLGVTLVIGGPMLAIWIQQWIVSSSPDYRDGVGAALGIAIFYFITLGFAVGAGVRALTLVLAAKGLRFRYVFMICVAGFAIVPAVLFGPAAWQACKMRPPLEARAFCALGDSSASNRWSATI